MKQLSSKALEALQYIEDEFGTEVLKELYNEPAPRVYANKLNEYHLKLLENCYIYSNNGCEFGGFSIDGKRPYGNSGVIEDIREITKLPNSTETLKKLHFSLHSVIMCIFKNPDKTPRELIGTDLKEYGLIDSDNKHLFEKGE